MFTFIIEYIRNYRGVGAVLPSSKILAKRMVKHIDFSSANTIIEYGAGTGVFTKEILIRKDPTTVFLIIECNKSFFKKLKEMTVNYENTIVLLGDATNIDKYCKEYLIGKIDYIVSGLPFASLPKRVSHKILLKTKKVLGNGLFITFQYSRINKKFFLRFFPSIKVKLVFRNIPPAYVFECKAEVL